MRPPPLWKKPDNLPLPVDGAAPHAIIISMKLITCVLLLICATWIQAGSCPEACKDVCGTNKSCCPSKGKSCGSVQLERGGQPASAYASKGGLRLR